MAEEESISAVEAVAVLAQCKVTAEKLLNSGSRSFLDKEDLASLRKFKDVKEAGWTDNAEVLEIAGLSEPQLGALLKALRRHINQL